MNTPDIYAVEVSALMVDPTVQRLADRRRINKIAGDFQRDAVGVLIVSKRANGDYHVIDGQHRLEALRATGHSRDMVTCQVYTGLTPAQEALLFRLHNNTTKVSYLDTFRVRLIEGDTTAADLVKILADYGWTPSSGSTSPGHFFALKAFERAYRLGRAVAEQTLAVCTSAWGHDPSSADGRIFDGLSVVLHRHQGEIDIPDLIDKLAKTPSGPAGVLGRSRGLRGIIGGSLATSVSEIVIDIYNGQRRSSKLPTWRQRS